MKAADQWSPGMWCGAALQLCDQHVVDVSEEKAIRYPRAVDVCFMATDRRRYPIPAP